tara:strand:+ start:1807 stop:2424 length:618 start_codon:yes stop_codon:yes gene_type:complete
MNQTIKTTKEQIMNHYGYGRNTFYRKLKYGINNYPNKIKKDDDFIELESSFLDKIFKNKRRPNRKEFRKVKNYVLRENWDYILCISPRRSSVTELKIIMENIFSEIKRMNRGLDVSLFYSIERNNNPLPHYQDDYGHVHSLIKVSSKNRSQFIVDLRRLLHSYDVLPHMIEYDQLKWNYRGKEYTTKDVFSWGEINYDYLVYKTR